MKIDATKRVFVFHGPESFLLSEYLRHVEAALEEAHGGFERFDFDGSSTDSTVVLDELRSYGLMQSHKLVVVDAADQMLSGGEDARGGGARQLFERYVEDPMEQATLVLRASRWNRGKLDKLIGAVGTIIKCEEPKPAQAAAWCVERCTKRHGASISREAATLLVDRIGANLARLDSELAKLVSAVSSDSVVIERELVVEMVGRSREEEAWELQSAILQGGVSGTMRTLRDLRNVARISEVLLIWAMADLARKIHAGAHMLSQGAPPRQVAQAIGAWGPKEGPTLDAARKVGPERAGILFHQVMQRAEAQRMGQAGGPDRTLEAMAVQMADTLG